MDYKRVLTLLAVSVLIVIVGSNTGIFWDNVLFVSKMGNPLFVNGIFNWNSIPLESDAGHPPFIATLMAAGWKLFGKSLATSHWIMLPFIFGLLWQISSFVRYFVKDKSLHPWAYILVIVDPTLLSQLVLVSPEVIQLFFFLLALNATLRNKTYLKITGLAFLGIVTYRGMMLCAGIFFIDILSHILINKKSIKSFLTKRVIVTYLIAATPAILYIVWRITVRGWISQHPTENWGNAWHFSSPGEFIGNLARNILVLGQRVADFGRIVPVLFVLITLYIKRKTIDRERVKPLMIIIVFSTIIIYVTSLLMNNMMGHRYYIPSFLALALLAFILLDEYKARKILYTLLLISLLAGNFIVYSDRFAQGWDASLAHMPYWNLRKDAIEYMDNNQLPVPETASFFPNKASIDAVDLNGDMRSFVEFTGNEKYVFYSNVYNLNDANLELLHNNYHIIKTFRKGKVRVEIMQKN